MTAWLLVELSQSLLLLSRQVVAEDGTLDWSEVYLFPHFETSGAHAFLRVFTAGNAKVLRSILWRVLCCNAIINFCEVGCRGMLHRLATVLQHFPCSLQITLSADHYLLVARHKGAAFTQRSAVPAADVTPGMLLWRRTESGSMAVEAVTSVQPVSAGGLVNPFTLRGAAPLPISGFIGTAHAVDAASCGSLVVPTQHLFCWAASCKVL